MAVREQRYTRARAASAVFIDAARFAVEDPDEIVVASLACGGCLRLPASVLLVEDELASVAVSWCLRCGASTQVSLDPSQVLRLVLRPPGSLVLQMTS